MGQGFKCPQLSWPLPPGPVQCPVLPIGAFSEPQSALGCGAKESSEEGPQGGKLAIPPGKLPGCLVPEHCGDEGPLIFLLQTLLSEVPPDCHY